METIRLTTVVGARPQFIKAAALSRAFAAHNAAGRGPAIAEYLVHTGQHYDHAMSQTFFDELGIAEPDVNLGVGSGSHGTQTARMLEGLERILAARRPDAVVVYGDTNSTLAGGLAAAKLGVPVVHVEAGLRSFDKAMPEELNRVLTDHLSNLLLCPTRAAVDNLRRESLIRGVVLAGDVMYDSLLHHREQALRAAPPLAGLTPGGYLLATVHRAANTDDGERLKAILSGLGAMARTAPVVLVLHPRTRRAMESLGLAVPEGVRAEPPLPYLAMVRLQAEALGVVTDSGGMQKEAFFLGRPCLTLREETEWTETVDLGANTLAGTDNAAMTGWLAAVLRGERTLPGDARPYGDGRAAERMVEAVVEHFCRG
ncbi:UDP-N-acetylglucosamine 2-epimerase [Pseudodesulfovibrio mercurii]|uniref:UDP-N-acetylglucosamine 2-epimerase n=1 Tax=Pseudodesulfovibrio mercurii TaxID=641491 RepID=F0JC59_9BACT|nr:UDP-N-acetylglucosamine 2-epimerase (non-hydrolyzing) [Pseudodesulfovibrio mercurii]EGB15632.1 UDP-N-acetylglucosamine 2-epimerase [Pseudodesulfovibrio mercurii]